jgi:hypothetical protein
VDEDCCAAYLMHRRHARNETGAVLGDHSPATRRAAAQVVINLLNYRELFTTDRPSQGLRPWGGASASAVAEMRSGREENKTPPVPDHVLQPLLAAALYAVTILGSDAVKLTSELRETATMRSRTAAAIRRARTAEESPHPSPASPRPAPPGPRPAARAGRVPGPQAAGKRLGPL